MRMRMRMRVRVKEKEREMPFCGKTAGFISKMAEEVGGKEGGREEAS